MRDGAGVKRRSEYSVEMIAGAAYSRYSCHSRRWLAALGGGAGGGSVVFCIAFSCA